MDQPKLFKFRPIREFIFRSYYFNNILAIFIANANNIFRRQNLSLVIIIELVAIKKKFFSENKFVSRDIFDLVQFKFCLWGCV